jgi:dephospho-CoA kinase
LTTTATEQPPLVIGLTGGIASGKSLAANRFADCGAEVIDTDRLARDVVAPGGEGLAQVQATFGPDVLTHDGQLDRAAMRQLIFEEPQARDRLEAITHPLIEERVQSALAKSTAPYAILVVPLLLERGWQHLTDRIAVVDCSVERQRARLQARDGTDAEDAERILSSQLSREQRLAHADDVLRNDGAAAALQGQVDQLDAVYRRIARTSSH